MFKDWDYQGVEQNADAIKKLGYDEIYLSKGEYPWHLATHCSEGGSHRLNIYTDVWFEAVSPSGIPLRWSFAIEPHSANGKGTYFIDVKGCREVIAKLQEPCRTDFKNYLNTCADAIEKQARELRSAMERELKTVETLRSI